MSSTEDFGPSVPMEVVRVTRDEVLRQEQLVATEVPCTIEANGVEVATLLATPADLEDLALGFLYSSGFINAVAEVTSIAVDPVRWLVRIEMARTPDPSVMGKRLFTAGCGKGVLYANLAEVTARRPLSSGLQVHREQIIELARWLQRTSPLYRETGAVHSAALSWEGEPPDLSIDDIGRHNAVDKAIGRGLREGINLGRTVLISTGRTSSEILHKTKRAGIPILVGRGAPTHQTVLRAREMGVTVVGFARTTGFTIFSGEERIRID